VQTANVLILVRVGFFTECYKPIVNGVVASIDALHDGLRARGVEVTTIAPHFPRFVDDVRDVVRIPSLPLPTQTAYRLCLPYLNAVDRRRVRGLDIVHAHSPFVTGWMGASYARRHRIPLVFTYHTRLDAYAHYAPFDRGATERAMSELTRRYANWADAVIVPTHAMEILLRELGVRAPIAVVPSAIDVEQFAAGRRSALVRARLGADDDAPLALVVSRLGMEKNVELALDALARSPELRLAVVGEGPHRAALEERARRLGVDGRVRFTGALARERLPDVYASVDAFVFPSTTDTQGLVLAEALAAGLPVIAADSEASRDVLAGAGRLVAPDPDALAAAIRGALAAGRDQSAVHLAFSRFTVEMQTRRILELYREVLAARAA
jgi:glycosyltransferase involved in cell wall biosynthesis